MAIIARLAVVLITRAASVFVSHSGLIMFMAKNTLEYFVVRGVHVTRRTRLPFAAMLAGIDAEILAVVIERRRQPRIHGVAGRAIV